jgi:hypothetical protein
VMEINRFLELWVHEPPWGRRQTVNHT